LQDSPRGEADGQSFIFPAINETSTSSSSGGGGSSTGDSAGGSSTATSATTTTSSSGATGNNSNNALNSNNRNKSLGNHLTLNTGERRNSLYCDTLHAGDSGIDSVQASPSPNALPPPPGTSLLIGNITGGSCNVSPATTPTHGSPNLSLGCGRMGARASISVGAPNYRRKSSALLHPDHARLFALRMKHAAALERAQTSPDQTSIEDTTEFHDNGLATNLRLCSASSSTTSSLTSVAAVSLGGGIGVACSSSSSAAAAAALAAAAGAGTQQRVSDPWLLPQSDREQDSRHHGRRRSSTATARLSLFDALDLEYALLRAAARGSVGPYSLSESIHKLTFTQSLAFPALARGLATKRRRSATYTSSRPLNPNESGLNTCAKVITAVILVGISFMVFFVVYKFVRT
ncbi:uncharacterized protein DDB_G0271670-like, partial [Teleopsis dalmanni]|uniref:uncharacterized protein DDB_G0271670-like n=1 Tax=Teleopsis dalmanni TaxID=139649 RepID=UPI0018CF5BFB